MTLNQAIRILERDAEFLGIPMLDLLRFIVDNPGAQKQSVLNAFQVYKEHALVRSNIS